MRWVSICGDGHLHEFDYSWWVHKGSKSNCKTKTSDIVLDFGKGHAYTLGQHVLTCSLCGRSKDMKRAPLVSEDDQDADKCRKYGEPWLQNNWEGREPCDKSKVHRQVGSASVTYNKGSSIMLIPLETSWGLANHHAVRGYLELPNLRKCYYYSNSRRKMDDQPRGSSLNFVILRRRYRSLRLPSIYNAFGLQGYRKIAPSP